MTWTQDRVDRLVKYWTEGRSAAEIAALLGGGVTREAICGKVFRLRLQKRDNEGRSIMQRRRRRQVSKGNGPQDYDAMRHWWRAKALKSAAEPVLDLPPVEATPPEKTVSWENLEPGMCRFPFGDPGKAEFGFCGAGAIPGQPYCAEHHARCYTRTYQPLRARDMAMTNLKIQKAKEILEEGFEV